MSRMVVDAKAKGLQVLLVLFGPYGMDTLGERRRPSRPRCASTTSDSARSPRQRSAASATGHQMGPDGLHPTQTGYDEMADAIARKLIAMFPRCGANGVCP